MPEKKKAAAKPAAKKEYASKAAHDKLRAEFNELKYKVGRALTINFDED